MTIEIVRPKVEALIQQQLQSGGFKDAEDVVFHALQSFTFDPASPPGAHPPPAKDMLELFAPLRGLNLVFESDRGNDMGRDLDL